MNKKLSQTIFQDIAIFLPILIMIGWICYYLFHSSYGAEVTLKITGADPRDLLAGHYLNYRIDYGKEIACTQQKPLCLCLKQVESHHEVDFIEHCSSRPQNCRFMLKGECQNRGFIAGIERFYFPEQYKDKLVFVPADSTIKVKLSKEGRGVVTALEVAGQPLMDWLLEQNH